MTADWREDHRHPAFPFPALLVSLRLVPSENES